MDENKRLKLIEIGYEIRPTCSTCAHGEFKFRMTWGSCSKHEYTHLKHTGPDRHVSIHVDGHCPSFKEDPAKVAKLSEHLGRWQEFLKMGL